jgi:hypothetical protein
MADTKSKSKTPKAPKPKRRGTGVSRGPRPKLAEANIATRFKPGTSGNPSGRPKSHAEAVAIAREITPKALRRLEQILEDPNSSDMAAVAAAREVYDRAHGRAPLAVADVTGEGSGGRSGLATLLGVTRVRAAMLGHDGDQPPTTEARISAATKLILDAARDGTTPDW